MAIDMLSYAIGAKSGGGGGGGGGDCNLFPVTINVDYNNPVADDRYPFTADKTFAEIAAAIDKKRGYVVFNPHAFEGEGFVKIGDKTAYVKGIAPKGHTATDSFVTENHVSVSGNKVETDRLSVTFDEDMQIVSYDGIFRQWSISNITSVEQPIEEMARQVVRLLIKKIHNEETPTRTVLKTKFVLGTTTK